MGVVTPEDLLLTTWTSISAIGKAFLMAQLGALLLAAVPAVRNLLRSSSWLGPLMIGPPLFWAFVETSFWMILVAETSGDHTVGYYLFPMVCCLGFIGATVLLQAGLGLALAQNRFQTFTMVGISMAFLAILGDLVLLLYVVSRL